MRSTSQVKVAKCSRGVKKTGSKKCKEKLKWHKNAEKKKKIQWNAIKKEKNETKHIHIFLRNAIKMFFKKRLQKYNKMQKIKNN